MHIIKAVCLGLAVSALAACDSETDKIGNASTVFRVLGKNDRIEIEGFDDADVKGITCYLSYAKKGGLKEAVNLEEDASDASVSCVQTGNAIEFNEQAVAKPQQRCLSAARALPLRACKSCGITMPSAKPSPI